MNKPGYKTSEFWLKLLSVLVSAFLASNLLPDEHWVVKIVGIVAVMLGALGYTVSRSWMKVTEAKATSMLSNILADKDPTGKK